MVSVPDSHRDLLEAQVATLATVGRDGRPQLSEVWFLAEDDRVRISLNTSRQKTKNLRRDPICTLLILDLAKPHRYLEIRADAVVEADDDYQFADRVGAKYNSDLREHDQAGVSRVVVTLVPVKINAVDMSA
ncbi:MAG TPA: PPOX class F420-dependent oxidoreductase [Acidimicrobiales bacterium]|jgi:PPOX class probable F420-dependent enzyme|nr:PPOX class F420-dependent oxidoreductase [Acidimicrobiales bacterium]